MSLLRETSPSLGEDGERRDGADVGEAVRILIIDDDEVDRLSVKRALRDVEMRVELVESGDAEEGLAALRTGPFDAVLLDFRLPGRDGLEVLRLARKEGIDAPVIMLTGHGDEQTAVEMMKAGASDYLAKASLTPARLAQTILRALRVYRAERQTRDAERAHAVQLRRVAEAAVAIHADLSLVSVERVVAHHAGALVPTASLTVRIATPHGDDGLLYGLLAPLLNPVRMTRAEIEGQPAWVRALDAAKLPRPSRAMLVTALLDRRGGRVGLIQLCDRGGDQDPQRAGLGLFTDGDAAILAQLAQSAVVAVENARLLESAQAASRARDDMLAIVSHDLRNPLNTISMTASVLLGPGASGAESRRVENVTRIKRAAERMNRLLEDLLDVSRIEAGTLAVDPRALALGALIDDALDALRPQAAEKEITFERVVPKGAPMVRADRDRVLQVLFNLLGNALKFTPKGGVIRARVERLSSPQGDAPDRLCVAIEDTGPGIPAADLPHLFDRYWQAKETAKLGAGLGLFIAKGIVVAHGGQIDVTSTVGEGATFTFTLPVAGDA